MNAITRKTTARYTCVMGGLVCGVIAAGFVSALAVFVVAFAAALTIATIAEHQARVPSAWSAFSTGVAVSSGTRAALEGVGKL